jgi:general secretion pathway protein E
MAPSTCQSSTEQFAALARGATIDNSQFASSFVHGLLQLASAAGASDVHLDPNAGKLEVRWRLDGVLHLLGQLPSTVAPNVISRLKVLAGLLTYEAALPQEGRICDGALGIEVRVSTYPSLYGERAVIRVLGAGDKALKSLKQLGLPTDVGQELQKHLAETSGAILIVGPAGSGKTTSAYACLRHIAAQCGGSRSMASLEDPVEIAVEEVAQSQVNLAAGFDMASGLRSLLRLDPEVILIGEMRDLATAEIALQAALTGQLVVTTFHAGDCADAVNRLVGMGIPGYAVWNAVRLVVAQRLVRRLCHCAQPADPQEHARPLGLMVDHCWLPSNCNECRGTGYLGRCLVAECRAGTSPSGQSVSIGQSTSTRPESPAAIGPKQGLWRSAAQLVEAGVTSPLEVVRVLGFLSGEAGIGLA